LILDISSHTYLQIISKFVNPYPVDHFYYSSRRTNWRPWKMAKNFVWKIIGLVWLSVYMIWQWTSGKRKEWQLFNPSRMIQVTEAANEKQEKSIYDHKHSLSINAPVFYPSSRRRRSTVMKWLDSLALLTRICFLPSKAGNQFLNS